MAPPSAPPTAPVPAPLPPRLKRRAEFLAVARGRKAAMPSLVLQSLPRGDDAPARLGFTVTRKVGNAVVRNRTRRRLKEAARLLFATRAAEAAPVRGHDLVLVGRAATNDRRFDLLIEDLAAALRKAGVP